MQTIHLNQYIGELDAAGEALERSYLTAHVSGLGGLGNHLPRCWEYSLTWTMKVAAVAGL